MIYELSSPVRSITGRSITGEVFRFCPARTAVAGAPPDFAGIVFKDHDDVALSWFTRPAIFDRTPAVGGARTWPCGTFVSFA